MKKQESLSLDVTGHASLSPRFICGGSDIKQGSICKCIDNKQKRGTFE